MSGLTKKSIYTDSRLASILGVSEGELVSYAEISKGVHKYIKDNNLGNVSAGQQPTKPQMPPAIAPEPASPRPASQAKPSISPSMKQCRDCGDDIPAQAAFCDLCGVRQ